MKDEVTHVINIRRQAGVSLGEVILVLVIVGMVFGMGIQQYVVYQRDVNLRQIVANVNTISQAAANYYYANCFGKTDPGAGTVIPGTLNPGSSPSNPFTLNMTNDLVTPGYLTTTIPLNPLIDSSGANNGYVVQYTRTDTPSMLCIDSGCSKKTQIGTTVSWNMQVAVKLSNPDLASQYSKITNATCVSSQKGTDGVASCDTASNYAAICSYYRSIPASSPYYTRFSSMANNLGCPASSSSNAYNNFLVFESKPSAYGVDNLPTLWQTNAVVKQFTQGYRTNPISNLTSSSHNPEYQYFLCGD